MILRWQSVHQRGNPGWRHPIRCHLERPNSNKTKQWVTERLVLTAEEPVNCSKKGSKIMDGLQINNALLCDRDLPPQRRRPQRWEERHVTRTLRTLQHRCARNHPASYQARKPLHFKKSTGSSSDTLSVSEDSHSQPHLHAQPFRHHLQTPVAPACWPCASPPIYH